MTLHHEDITDALREAILVAGGHKTVGALMYPEDAPDHAAGHGHGHGHSHGSAGRTAAMR